MPDEQNYENWYIRCQMACRAPFWPLYIHQNAPPLLRADSNTPPGRAVLYL